MKRYSLFLFVFVSLLVISAFAQSKATKKPVIPERVINYNSAKVPLNKMFNECVGAGRANEGLRADWQQQLAYVKKEYGFRYIRFHGLLTEDMWVGLLGIKIISI
jgi:xylan 1,4-beta-xylosidase